MAREKWFGQSQQPAGGPPDSTASIFSPAFIPPGYPAIALPVPGQERNPKLGADGGRRPQAGAPGPGRSAGFVLVLLPLAAWLGFAGSLVLQPH